MTGKITKKNKRGERGSIGTEELSSSKQLNMADTELQLDNAPSSNPAAAKTDEHEPTQAELRGSHRHSDQCQPYLKRQY